jgi:threonyl-tRNA synthetase
MNLLQKYQSKVKLPFKIFETGTVHRYEIAGALRGLLRVRAFTQDDAHIFAREEDVESSLLEVFDMMKDVYEKLFHIPVTSETVKLRLSLSDKSKIGDEFMGEPEMWEFAEEKLFKVAEEIKRKHGIEFFAEEGEAAFYGPKLDVVVYEEGGKEWQIGTAQFDFNLPKRFKLVELLKQTHGFEGNLYMIHRALLGSLERFLGIYLEMYKGRLPFVLAPVQALVVGILTGKEVDEKIKEVVTSVEEMLKRNEIRAASTFTTKTHLSKDVRKIESTIKPALMIYVGQREAESGKVAVRPYLHSQRKRVQKLVDPEEIMNVIEDMERGATELAGSPVRLPADPSYMV